MKTVTALIVLGLAGAFAWAAGRWQDMPEMPKPQKEHEFLKKFEGNWDVAFRMRMNADDAWMESKGTERNRMMGDFWLVTEAKYDMGERPMESLGMNGYDPFKKKYVMTWSSGMSPVLSEGEGSVEGKVLTTKIRSTDCQSGQPMEMRMTQEFKDNDTVVWSMFLTGKDGTEFETMKGESKRRK